MSTLSELIKRTKVRDYKLALIARDAAKKYLDSLTDEAFEIELPSVLKESGMGMLMSLGVKGNKYHILLRLVREQADK